MAEKAPAPGADRSADQRPGPVRPGWPREQVAGPHAGGRDAAPARGGNALLAGPATEKCWLCGARLDIHMLVADGGSACTDVRWYCRNTRVCTDRWTAQR